ncbi:MAG: ribosome biogenesis GTPase Der [Gemmatimonadetes bacterium]|nr:ribosome biogenesis GTPase Der [Gemmatimonadota bacterium]
MRRALPAVAVVGRPNVGKSTLFNRIIGQRLAIVEEVPGVTRDRHFALADWAGRHFYVIDTGGLETDPDEPLTAAVRHQVLAAIQEADLIVFVVDGRAGPHPLDARIAELLRRADRRVLLVVNKLDRLPEDLGHHDFWALGLGEPLPVSALSGKGSGEVLDAITARLPEAPPEAAEDTALHVAVIGKPNVGKSSFVNRLLGEERMVVAETAGTTRDSVDTPLRYHGRTLVFIDTAGLRRHARVEPGLEYFAALRTERAIERSDICLLLLDATEPVHVQDLKIAEKAWETGRGLIVVANKWDLVEKDEKTALTYEQHLRERAPTLRWVPVIFTSALTGQRVQRTLDLVLEVAAQRSRRLPTHEVNEALRELVERQQPPHYRGQPVKLLYATQAQTEPPTFVIFSNYPRQIPDNYVRYLHNGFRERWDFVGTPLRFRFRARKERK